MSKKVKILIISLLVAIGLGFSLWEKIERPIIDLPYIPVDVTPRPSNTPAHQPTTYHNSKYGYSFIYDASYLTINQDYTTLDTIDLGDTENLYWEVIVNVGSKSYANPDAWIAENPGLLFESRTKVGGYDAVTMHGVKVDGYNPNEKTIIFVKDGKAFMLLTRLSSLEMQAFLNSFHFDK